MRNLSNLYVDGVVGIGTTSPSKKLHVIGDAWINRPSNKVDNNGATEFGSRVEFNNSFASGQSGYMVFRYPTYNNFLIGGDYDGNIGGGIPNIQFGRSNGTVYMHIDANGGTGNVGIGTTSPSEKLDVAGNIQVNGNYIKFNEGTNAESRIVSSANYLEIIGNGPSAASGARMWLGKGGSVDSGYYVNGGQLFFRGLDSSTKMYINGTSGNVGIGTTSPAYKLDVQDATNGIIRAYGGSIGRLSLQNSTRHYSLSVQGSTFYLYDEVGAATRMAIDSTGNVGIGTTSPTSKLDVAGAVRALGLGSYFGNSSTSYSYAVLGAFSNGVNNIPFVAKGYSGQTADLTRWVDSSNNILNVVDALGNVGIGTTSPAVDLHVADDVRIDDQLYVRSISSQYFSSSNNLGLIYGDAANFTVSSNATERFRITSGGNVLIGTTTDSGDKLRISGDMRTDGTITSYSGTNARFFDSGANITFHQFESYWITNSASSTATLRFDVGTWRLWNATAGGTVLSAKSSGNVGIGTTAPAVKLEIKTTTSDTTSVEGLRVYNAGGGVGAGVKIGLGVGATYSEKGYIRTDIVSGGAGRMFFGVNGSDVVTINNSSNVGIGTTSPAYKLDVVGEGKVTGKFRVGGAVMLAEPGTGVLLFGSEGGSQTAIYSASLERIRINSSGNVGIGTTSPSSKLDVAGTWKLAGLQNSAYFSSYDWGTELNISAITSGGWARANRITTSDSGGSVFFGVLGNNTTLERAYWTVGDVSTINATGYSTNSGIHLLKNSNVGIGTASPTTKLDVNGVITATGGNSTNWNTAYSWGNHASAGYLTSEADTLDTVTGRGATTANAITTSTHTISNGYLILSGATTSVNPEIEFTDDSGFGVAGYKLRYGNADGWTFYDSYWASGGGHRFRTSVATSTIEALAITHTGNVGIGTTSPAQKLDVSQGSIFLSGSGSKYLYIRRHDGLGTHSFGVGSDEKLILSLSGSNPFIIDGGNVLIGTTTDAGYKLDVNGSTKIGGPLTIRQGATDQNTSSDSATIPSTTGAEFLRIEGIYTNGQYTHELAKIDRGGNLPLYIRESKGTANSFSNIARFGSHSYSAYEFEVFGDINATGNVTGANLNISNWNTAYGWGNHASAGYLTSEADTLATVTTRGNTTTNSINTGDIAVTSGGNGNSGLTIKRATSSGRTQMMLADESGTQIWRFGLTGGGSTNFAFFDGTQNAMTLNLNGDILMTPGGNIGIGTTSPIDKLQVSGSLFVTGKIYNGSTNDSAGITFPSSTTRIDGFNGITFHASSTNVGSQSERMRITSAGNVGIGTSSPAGKLSIEGDGSEYSNIVFKQSAAQEHLIYASTNFQYNLIGSSTPTWIWGQQSASERMRLNNTGLGIGTTSPQTELHVKGNNGWGEVRIEGQTFASGHGASLEFYSEGTALADVYASTDKHLYFRTNGTTERMRITSAGNVGIGTTSPSTKLEVVGTIRLHDGLDNGRILFRQDRSDVYIQENAFGLTFGAPSGMFFETDSNNNGNGLFNITRQGVSSFYIDDNRNVGIGTTSPSQKLHVVGDARIEGNLTINGTVTQIDTNTLTTEQWLVTNDGTGPAVVINQKGSQPVIDIQDDGSSVLYIADGGNVGIGTTSPAQRLEVNGAILLQNNNELRWKDTGAIQRTIVRVNSSNELEYGWSGAGPVKFMGGGSYTERMRVHTNGNVGIGTTSPAQKLHVVGKALITDDVQLTGSNPRIDFNSNGASSLRFYDTTNASERVRIDTSGNVGIGTTTPVTKLDVNGSITAGGKIFYSKSYASLDTTGVAIAGLTTGGNGSSALYEFTMHGGSGGYQRVIYSCQNAAGNWYAYKVIDEGTNNLDVEASANGLTITFTFKARSSTQYYSPRVHVEFLGSNIDTSYL